MNALLAEAKSLEQRNPLEKRIGLGSLVAVVDIIPTGPDAVMFICIDEWGQLVAWPGALVFRGGLPMEWNLEHLRKPILRALS